jgi:RimJ/RimL family protein N-acetyltransferase
MANMPEYNRPALRLFANAGFVEEVRRREAIHRDGQRWDLIQMSLLRPEWTASR